MRYRRGWTECRGRAKLQRPQRMRTRIRMRSSSAKTLWLRRCGA